MGLRRLARTTQGGPQIAGQEDWVSTAMEARRDAYREGQWGARCSWRLKPVEIPANLAPGEDARGSGRRGPSRESCPGLAVGAPEYSGGVGNGAVQQIKRAAPFRDSPYVKTCLSNRDQNMNLIASCMTR